MKDKTQLIRRCCSYFDYVWPKEIISGILFFEGTKITIEEFMKQARLFRG